MGIKLEMPILIGASLVLTTVISLFIWKMKNRKKVYVPVAKVKSLFFYPVKSLKGIEVKEIDCLPTGVRYCGIQDRSYMLISKDHVVVTLREEPILTLLAVSMENNSTFVIVDPNGNTLKLNMIEDMKKNNNVKDRSLTCRIHNSTTPAVDCGDAAAKFFNNFLGREDIRLVRFVEILPKRECDKGDPLFPPLFKTQLAFQDLSPINVVSQASIDDLNSRMEEKVSVYNFKPNVLLTDTKPFDEDNWKYLKFSSGAEIEVKVPCTRCVLTTVDPETGVKTNREPIKTLRKFRMLKDYKLSKSLGHAPALAINCWSQNAGKIAVGDDVFAVIQKNFVECK